MAVGRRVEESGAVLTLAERLSGGTWTIVPSVSP